MIDEFNIRESLSQNLAESFGAKQETVFTAKMIRNYFIYF